MQCRIVVVMVIRVDISPVIEEKLTNIGPALECRMLERGHSSLKTVHSCSHTMNHELCRMMVNVTLTSDSKRDIKDPLSFFRHL